MVSSTPVQNPTQGSNFALKKELKPYGWNAVDVILCWEVQILRKSPIPGFGTNSGISAVGSWTNLEQIAIAELSSEDPRYPFEQALRTDLTEGWKASSEGPQLIRLCFDSPQSVRRIRLQFREDQVERSQEIALFATSTTSQRKELVRQQWVFSPNGATSEIEDYFFDLKDVTTLELEIDPGRHNKQVFASLQSIQIG